MTNSETLEERVESFVAAFKFDDLTTVDITAAKTLLKDNLAVAVGASTLPWSQAVERYASEQAHSGPSTVAASGHEVAPGTAAFLNATFTHGFEYDDAHGPSDGHPGSVVSAVSLAVAEAVEATVGETLAALVAGYEVYTRLGTVASPNLIGRGWHPHAVLGNFGGTVAAAKLWDLNRTEIRHALAIAASHAGGLTEYSSTGGSIKRVHAGMGARNGIHAARMAKNGVTGPRLYLTGNKGFYPTFLDKNDVGPDEFGKTDDLEIHNAWLKQHACCGCTHPYIDCVEKLNPNPDRVDLVRTRVQPKSNSIIGTANENLYTPTNIEEAQFNLPFEVALALLGHGNGFATHRKVVNGEIALDDPELLAMMQRVKLEPDPELAERYGPKFVGEMIITYEDGTEEHAFVEDASGTVENPPTEAKSKEKFRELTVPLLGADQATNLWTTVDDTQQMMSVREITSLIH